MSLANAEQLTFNAKKEKTMLAVLGGNSDCLEEPGGARSLYRVFALPDTVGQYILTVAAQRWGNTILAPRVMLLDNVGSLKRTTTHDDFAFRGEDLSTLLRSHSDEKYLAILSDPSAVGQVVSRIREVAGVETAVAGPYFFTVSTGFDTTTNLSLVAEGRVTVTLAPLPEK